MKELRLSYNNLSGNLSSIISRLTNLETLDLQGNKLLSLPESLRELVHLHVLDVSRNQLTGVPMDALEGLPITELNVANNALVGALFPFSVSGMRRLRMLDVANNALASLAFSDTLALPDLRTLNIANNRIVGLPDVSGWGELLTLAAGDNKISTLPDGFGKLKKIKQADFTGNSVSKLPEDLALMDSLETLVISGNPIKERRFFHLTTAEIKRDLRSRLDPNVGAENPENDFEDETLGPEGPAESPSQWKLTANGALDLSGKGLADADVDAFRSYLSTNDVREMQLARNTLTTIPFELCLAQNLRSLDLSYCLLGTHYLTEVVTLPALQHLDLSGNAIVSFGPLIGFVHAPRLQCLDVSKNKINGDLPALRTHLPNLTELAASDNRINSISAKALSGFHTVGLARNDIAHVPPEIGLLWDQGLRGLDLGSNAFRVPSYRILEKGTDATLRWLREKIPEDALIDDSDGFF